MKKQKSVIGNFFSYLLLIILLVLAVGGAWYFLRPFTATKNGNALADFDLIPFETVQIDLHFPITQQDKNYSVSVISYAEDDFDFKADGIWHTYGAEKLDFTDFFMVEKSEKYFTITCVSSYKRILQEAFPQSRLSDFPEEIDDTKPLYKLVVKSEAKTVEALFSCKVIDVDSVSLSQKEVIL